MLPCECCVVFVSHVCLDRSCLFVHGESSGKSGACVANVVVALKSTTFKRAVILVNYVGAHQPLCFCQVISHRDVLLLVLL